MSIQHGKALALPLRIDGRQNACRCDAIKARQQAEACAHADREQQLRRAVDRLQVVAQQSDAQAASRPVSDGRLQAAQARCDRAEGRLVAQQGRTQQVTPCSMHN